MDQKPVCRYWAEGNCKSNNCPYPHPTICRNGQTCKDRSCKYFHPGGRGKDFNSPKPKGPDPFADALAKSNTNKICKYFQQGSCKDGSRCQFAHPDPNSFTASLTGSMNGSLTASTTIGGDPTITPCKYWKGFPGSCKSQQCPYPHPAKCPDWDGTDGSCTTTPCSKLHLPRCRELPNCRAPNCPFPHPGAPNPSLTNSLVGSLDQSASTRIDNGNVCKYWRGFQGSCKNMKCQFPHPPRCQQWDGTAGSCLPTCTFLHLPLCKNNPCTIPNCPYLHNLNNSTRPTITPTPPAILPTLDPLPVPTPAQVPTPAAVPVPVITPAKAPVPVPTPAPVPASVPTLSPRPPTATITDIPLDLTQSGAQVIQSSSQSAKSEVVAPAPPLAPFDPSSVPQAKPLSPKLPSDQTCLEWELTKSCKRKSCPYKHPPVDVSNVNSDFAALTQSFSGPM